MYNIGEGLGTFILVCFLTPFCIWGIWEVVDYFFIEDSIESKTLVVPEIRLEVNDNKVDTIYVYSVH